MTCTVAAHINCSLTGAAVHHVDTTSAAVPAWQVYRQQFMKLLQALQEQFVAQLAQSSDPDTKPSLARLQTYINKQQWRNEPEGRKLPALDESSQVLG